MTLPSLQSFLDLFLAGLSLGGIYTLLAFALSLALATTHVLNIAHGSFMVLSAALATLLIRVLGLNWILSVGAILVLFALIGMIFEVVVVRPLMGRSHAHILIGSILITFGLGLVIDSSLGYFWAKYVDPEPTFGLSFYASNITFFGVSVSASRLIILCATIVAVLLLHFFLHRTRLGTSIRAISENHDGAVILGVNPALISRVIYVICFVLMAAAGVLIVLAIPLEPYSGLPLTLTALTVVVIGGVGSLPGALLGGCLLGLVEVATAYTLGSIWAPVISVSVFFAVLLVRPQGVLGSAAR